MRRALGILLGIACCAGTLCAQTAEELVAKNTAAKGGLDKIKAIKSYRASGVLEFGGGFKLKSVSESKRPDLLRQEATIQGMTQIVAYDGSNGWQISPFGGRRDPEALGEDDLRSLTEDADFDGPLIDAAAKGNKVEYLGKDLIDGDDALRLQVTLKNGDIVYYYLDPETFLEFRTERRQFIRGAVRETATEYGSYKPVAGVLYPFSIETGPKNQRAQWQKISIDKMEVNIPIDDAAFKMPTAPAAKPAAAEPKK